MVGVWRAAYRLALGLSVVLGSGRASAQELDLETAVAAAIRTHERVKLADARVEQAEAELEVARSEFLPSLTLGASATARPSEDATGRYVTGAGTLTLVQPLLAPSAIPRLASSEHTLNAQTWARDEERRRVAFDTSRAFLAALLAERVLEASENRLVRARTNLATAVARAEAELNSSNDVTRAKLDVASALRDLTARKRDRTAARLALELLTGTTVTKVTPPQALLAASMKPLASNTATPRRLDLKSLDEQLLAQQDLADEPLFRLIPSLDLVAQLRVNPDPIALQPWHDESLTLSFSWTIFDAGRRYADQKAQSARTFALETQRALNERTFATDVRVATTNLEAAQESFRYASDASASSRASVDETNELYQQGLARSIEVTDANAEAYAAELEAASSQIEIARSYLELRFSLGLQPLEEVRP